jgi:hypothetical protein
LLDKDADASTNRKEGWQEEILHGFVRACWMPFILKTGHCGQKNRQYPSKRPEIPKNPRHYGGSSTPPPFCRVIPRGTPRCRRLAVRHFEDRWQLFDFQWLARPEADAIFLLFTRARRCDSVGPPGGTFRISTPMPDFQTELERATAPYDLGARCERFGRVGGLPSSTAPCCCRGLACERAAFCATDREDTKWRT